MPIHFYYFKLYKLTANALTDINLNVLLFFLTCEVKQVVIIFYYFKHSVRQYSLVQSCSLALFFFPLSYFLSSILFFCYDVNDSLPFLHIYTASLPHNPTLYSSIWFIPSIWHFSTYNRAFTFNPAHLWCPFIPEQMLLFRHFLATQWHV